MTTLFNQWQSLHLQCEANGENWDDMQTFAMLQLYYTGCSSALNQVLDAVNGLEKSNDINGCLDTMIALVTTVNETGLSVADTKIPMTAERLFQLASKPQFRAFIQCLHAMEPPIPDPEFYASRQGRFMLSLFLVGMANALHIMLPGIGRGDVSQIGNPLEHIRKCKAQIKTVREAHGKMAGRQANHRATVGRA